MKHQISILIYITVFLISLCISGCVKQTYDIPTQKEIIVEVPKIVYVSTPIVACHDEKDLKALPKNDFKLNKNGEHIATKDNLDKITDSTHILYKTHLHDKSIIKCYDDQIKKSQKAYEDAIKKIEKKDN